MITDDKINRLVQAILDSSDGHDMESYAEDVLDEDEVEGFLDYGDGSDQESVIEEYVESKTDDEVEELFKDYDIK